MSDESDDLIEQAEAVDWSLRKALEDEESAKVDEQLARLRDTNQLLVHELAAAKRREDGWRIRAEQAERRAKALTLPSQPRTCATCHAVLADGPQPAATYEGGRLPICKWPTCECPKRGQNCIVDWGSV